jgi:hypothetical protein
MEAVGVAAWSSGGGAILSKVAGSPSSSGSQVLRITKDGAATDWASQTIISTRLQRVTGWARTDGIIQARYGLGVAAWTSLASTTWQYFSIIVDPTVTSFGLVAIGGAATNWVEFDDIKVTEINTSPNEAIQNASHNLNQVEFSTTDTAALEFTTRGPADTGFWIDWGDGNREWVAHVGTSTDVVTSHNYGGLVGTKPITFEGVLSDIIYFDCHDTTFGGNISAFSIMEKLLWLYVYDTAITGDISGVSGLTSLTLFYAYNTAITGNIDSLASLTSLVSLNVRTNNLSGDIGALAPLSNMTLFVARNCTVGYNSTTLPAWAGTLTLQDNAMTATEVDNFLIDLDIAGGSNGTLNISGTNATRTSASDAAKTSLLGKGWTITVNE